MYIKYYWSKFLFCTLSFLRLYIYIYIYIKALMQREEIEYQGRTFVEKFIGQYDYDCSNLNFSYDMEKMDLQSRQG